MRIERTGNIEPLTPRVIKYLREGLKAKNFDDMLSPEQRRPDFSCFKDILVIELKTLEKGGAARMENLNDELRQRPDYPAFYGHVPVESLIKNMGDQEAIRRKMADRFARAIISHLRKAKDQLAAHANRNPGRNLVKVVLLINKDHEIYEPEMVQFTLMRALSKRENDKLVYEEIDAVIYMTERHAVMIGDKIAFPLLTIEGDGMIQNPWKEQFVDRFLDGWAAWNNQPSYKSENNRAADFETIDHIPDKMPRHELWRLEYRRHPYMQDYTDEKIRDLFDESNVMTALAMTNGSPMKFPQEAIMQNMRGFTHLLLEINRRALPAHKMRYTLERGVAACERLKIPPQAVAFMRHLESSRKKTTDSRLASL